MTLYLLMNLDFAGGGTGGLGGGKRLPLMGIGVFFLALLIP